MDLVIIKLAKDIFDWQDIKDWFLVVELENDPRANRPQPI